MSNSRQNNDLNKIGADENSFDGHFICPPDFGISLCENSEQSFLIRTYRAVSEPVLLTQKIAYKSASDGYDLVLQDSTGQFICQVHCAFTRSGLRFQATYSAPEPIWLVEWSLTNLNLAEVIIPALGGQVVTDQMPDQTTLSYKYPFWLNAQFVVGVKGNRGLIIYSHDASTNLKLARVRRENGSFTISYGFEPLAKKRLTSFATEWFIEEFTGDWQKPVAEYRTWMEKAFKIKPLPQKSNFPDWAKDINFILEIWGARRETQKPHHTFEQIIERLREFKKLHNPRQTLLYLPGFAEHGIDSHIPDYNPSDLLGGEEKFKELIDTAHTLGFKVMIHTNVLGMTFTHPKYPEFKKYQVIDAFGRRQGWAMDIDGDWLTEPYFAYINPGAQAWSDLMIETLGRLINKFWIDAVFLDQTLLAFNVNRGPDFIWGMRTHIKKLQKAFPEILFAGEGLHEQIAGCLPVAQIHGIDSLSGVHGLEGQEPWRKVHPVSSYLFGNYTRYVAHLLTRHPSNPAFKLQEAAYSQLNVIPALGLYENDQAIELPETYQMIERAKKLNKEGNL